MITSLVSFYPCKDIVETTHFYTQILPLKLHVDQGAAKIFDTGYGFLGFCQYEHQQLATYTCISFNVNSKEEVDEYYISLKEKRVKMIHAPMLHQTFDVYSFFFYDPNGYKLEIQKLL